MLKVSVCHEYYCGSCDDIELPIERWSEVKAWFIKWNKFHYTLDNETWEEIELPDLDPLCDVDQKRPVNSSIRDPNTGDVIEEG